jgi:hypothetical protein
VKRSKGVSDHYGSMLPKCHVVKPILTMNRALKVYLCRVRSTNGRVGGGGWFFVC